METAGIVLGNQLMPMAASMVPQIVHIDHHGPTVLMNCTACANVADLGVGGEWMSLVNFSLNSHLTEA